MDYHAYLKSEEWKDKRDRRVLIDGKCAICGKPFNLQVHHLTYQNVPNEKTTDLVTLCGNCHQKIERMKNRPGSDSFNALNILLQYQFCEDHLSDDLSGGGIYDFCKYEVIKKQLWPFLKEHHGNAEQVSGCIYVQNYFRNRRYEIILDYMKHGYPPYLIHNRTNFSRAMIRKVFEKPEQAKRELEIERERFNKINNKEEIQNEHAQEF